MDQFSYYMIRVQHPPADHAPADRDAPTEHRREQLAGVVEQLATGEKRSFADCDELLRLLNGWGEGRNNMRAGSGGGKA